MFTHALLAIWRLAWIDLIGSEPHMSCAEHCTVPSIGAGCPEIVVHGVTHCVTLLTRVWSSTGRGEWLSFSGEERAWGEKWPEILSWRPSLQIFQKCQPWLFQKGNLWKCFWRAGMKSPRRGKTRSKRLKEEETGERWDVEISRGRKSYLQEPPLLTPALPCPSLTTTFPRISTAAVASFSTLSSYLSTYHRLWLGELVWGKHVCVDFFTFLILSRSLSPSSLFLQQVECVPQAPLQTFLISPNLSSTSSTFYPLMPSWQCLPRKGQDDSHMCQSQLSASTIWARLSGAQLSGPYLSQKRDITMPRVRNEIAVFSARMRDCLLCVPSSGTTAQDKTVSLRNQSLSPFVLSFSSVSSDSPPVNKNSHIRHTFDFSSCLSDCIL